jgi:hypothetical protein
LQQQPITMQPSTVQPAEMNSLLQVLENVDAHTLVDLRLQVDMLKAQVLHLHEKAKTAAETEARLRERVKRRDTTIAESEHSIAKTSDAIAQTRELNFKIISGLYKRLDGKPYTKDMYNETISAMLQADQKAVATAPATKAPIRRIGATAAIAHTTYAALPSQARLEAEAATVADDLEISFGTATTKFNAKTTIQCDSTIRAALIALAPKVAGLLKQDTGISRLQRMRVALPSQTAASNDKQIIELPIPEAYQGQSPSNVASQLTVTSRMKTFFAKMLDADYFKDLERYFHGTRPALVADSDDEQSTE